MMSATQRSLRYTIPRPTAHNTYPSLSKNCVGIVLCEPGSGFVINANLSRGISATKLLTPLALDVKKIATDEQ